MTLKDHQKLQSPTHQITMTIKGYYKADVPEEGRLAITTCIAKTH
jgi:hypothetical protein